MTQTTVLNAKPNDMMRLSETKRRQILFHFFCEKWDSPLVPFSKEEVAKEDYFSRKLAEEVRRVSRAYGIDEEEVAGVFKYLLASLCEDIDEEWDRSAPLMDVCDGCGQKTSVYQDPNCWAFPISGDGVGTFACSEACLNKVWASLDSETKFNLAGLLWFLAWRVGLFFRKLSMERLGDDY
jgi:hypothetical protein